MENDQLKGIGLTLGAMALTALVFILSQLQASIVERPMLKKQVDYFADKYGSSQTALRENDVLFKTREEQIQNMVGTEARYTNLISSLMELAKTDSDARMIALKWKIQVSGAPLPAPSKVTEGVAGEPKESKATRSVNSPLQSNPKTRIAPQ